MSNEVCDPALESFVSKRDDLLALAMSFVSHPDVAEDIVQDSWIRWQSKCYPPDRAVPIFRTIVANLARDWFRREKRNRESLDAHFLLTEHEVDSERVVIARQDLRRVARALGTLSEKSLAALKLHRIDGLTYREIGERLDVSYARAYQLVAQALARSAMAMED